MKKETRKLIFKIALWCSPVFAIIMYLLPWSAIYKYKIGTGEPTNVYYNYFEALQIDISLMTTIVMWVSLIGIFISLLIYLSTLIFKKREKLLNKISSLVLLICTALLLLTPLFKTGGSSYKEWIEFLTLPYGLTLVYEAILVYYVFSLDSKKKTTH